MDEKQDYDLKSLTETGGKTTMKFKRQFDTCDDQDNKIEVRLLLIFLIIFLRFTLSSLNHTDSSMHIVNHFEIRAGRGELYM